MDKKIIDKAKRLINLAYNQFNLDNYFPILYKTFGELGFRNTDSNLPIKLMSGQHKNAGIISCNNLISPYRKKNIYIIGKGILFDSGGLDLKDGMLNMNNDKAGMIIALAVADYCKNVTAWCPVTTNLIQTSQITPGDIIKIGNKKVLVSNTDAEGRLVLAEAISTLTISKSDIIITIATLTGAVEDAIGRATGVFTDNPNLACKYMDASKKANEICWKLPLWEYLEKKYYKGKIIKNEVKEIKCGATEGALFIKQFIPYPENWIHLDIAASAFDDKEKANGVPIKSLINFIKELK
jgi:leucyl aminopeptidase